MTFSVVYGISRIRYALYSLVKYQSHCNVCSRGDQDSLYRPCKYVSAEQSSNDSSTYMNRWNKQQQSYNHCCDSHHIEHFRYKGAYFCRRWRMCEKRDFTDADAYGGTLYWQFTHIFKNICVSARHNCCLLIASTNCDTHHNALYLVVVKSKAFKK